MDLEKLTALELGNMIRQKEIKIKEVLDHVFEKSEEKNSPYSEICKETAYSKGEEIQKKTDEDKCDFPLSGVPFIVNDNISVKGIKCQCGSIMLEDYTPVFDATVIERLTEAGGIVSGKAKMKEFVVGGYKEENACTQDDIYKTISQGDIFYGLDSDLGIDGKQKACEYGLTSIKPTSGAISRYGLISTASSLEQICPIGKNILDCAYVFAEISGNDEKDGTTRVKETFNVNACLKEDINGLKIVVPKEFTDSNASLEIKNKIKDVASFLEKQGAVISEEEIFNTEEYGDLKDYILPSYYTLLFAELSACVSKYDGIKYGHSEKTDSLFDKYTATRTSGFGEELKEKILLGSLVLSKDYFDDYYKKALGVRQILKTALDKTFDKFDMILSPLSLGITGVEGKSDENCLYSVLSHMYGSASVSFPYSAKESNPLGIQLIGKPFSEDILIRTAFNYQINTDFQNLTEQGRSK